MPEITKIDISLRADENLLLKLLETKNSPYISDRAFKLLQIAQEITKPKYIIKKFNIDEIGYDYVVINSQRFNSKIIANKLNGHSSVFVFIVTGGREIEEYSNTVLDFLDRYILDKIAYMGYLSALEDMQNALFHKFGIEKYTSLAAGSIQDWNVEEVNRIFELLGDDCNKIGVSVLKSGMITPLKSTSGILFETNNVFSSCEICEKLKCPTRAAEFNIDEYIKTINL